MRLFATLLSVFAIMAFCPGASAAQVALEARLGAAIPTGDFGDLVSTGVGIEATAGYAVMPNLEVYAGLGWARFGTDFNEELEADGPEIVDSGLMAGVRLAVPVLASLQPWVRGGVIYNKFEMTSEGPPFSISVESERSFGFEIGGGLGFSVGQNLSITPGVRYRSYSPDLEEQESVDLDLEYLAVDIGARIAI